MNKFFILFATLSLLTIFLKVSVSTLGHNYDLESGTIVAKIINEGKSVYANTDRYNYGPIKSLYLGAISLLSQFSGVKTLGGFHALIALFLSLIDISISIVILKIYGKKASILYLINPISILISGYHSQHDNIAVLFALLSWLTYLNSKSKNKDLLISLFIGLSLCTKHILFLFPLWYLLLASNKKDFLKNMKVAVFSYLIFFTGFAIDILIHADETSKIIKGILGNVFEYRGVYHDSFVANLTNLFVPQSLIDTIFINTPIFKGMSFLWVSIVTTLGILLIRKKLVKKELLLPIYLLVVFIFSPSLADQYLAIPLIIIILSEGWLTIFFFLATFLYLVSSNSSNIGSADLIQKGILINKTVLRFFPWNFGIKDGLFYNQVFQLKHLQGIGFLTFLSLLFNRPLKKPKIFKIILTIFLLLNTVLLLNILLQWRPNKRIGLHVISINVTAKCPEDKTTHTINVSTKNTCKGKNTCEINITENTIPCIKMVDVKWFCGPERFQKIFYSKKFTGVEKITCEDFFLPKDPSSPLDTLQ